jgi:hypothetical protein
MRAPYRHPRARPRARQGPTAVAPHAWQDENCGADGWTMTPSGMRGVLSEAVSIYFADVTLPSAFIARWWCVGRSVETTGRVPCARG